MQRGFGVVFVLIGLLITGIVVGGGYYFYQQQKIKNSEEEKKKLQLPQISGSANTNEVVDYYPNLEQGVEGAKQNLAGSLGITLGDIKIIDKKPVTWTDTCLGGEKQISCGVKADVPGYMTRVFTRTS